MTIKNRVPYPKDGNNNTIGNLTPAVPAIAVTYDATVSSSTEITLNAATTLIEVAAIDKAILLRWGTSDASTSAFDEVITANSVRQFYVPVNPASATHALYTAVNFIEEHATAHLVVTEK